VSPDRPSETGDIMTYTISYLTISRESKNPNSARNFALAIKDVKENFFVNKNKLLYKTNESLEHEYRGKITNITYRVRVSH